MASSFALVSIYVNRLLSMYTSNFSPYKYSWKHSQMLHLRAKNSNLEEWYLFSDFDRFLLAYAMTLVVGLHPIFVPMPQYAL